MTVTRDQIAEVLAQHASPGFDTWADVDYAAEPAVRVRRTTWKCMCGWRSEVQTGFDPTPAHQHVADALVAVIPALHPGNARTEWGVRRPTQHFGIKVDKARDEEHAREWVAVLHDTEHVLNANPNAEVVSRTVTETEWTTPEETTDGY